MCTGKPARAGSSGAPVPGGLGPAKVTVRSPRAARARTAEPICSQLEWL